VIIEDRIRDLEGGRSFSPRSCPAAKAVAKFPAPLTSSVPQENSRASQLNCIRRANQPISSHKIHARDREIWQVKSPNSVIKTHPNLLKINDGDMLKSPKNSKTRFSRPPTFRSMRSRFFTVFPPHATAGPSQNRKWSRPLLPGSAQNIECDVTYTKQTTEDFLPGATTHIRKTRFAQHPDASPLGFPK
jgi:hypothetical protein